MGRRAWKSVDEVELLNAIDVDDGFSVHRIELYYGDLLEQTAEDGVDILVISAFPNDYAPTANSVIGTLDRIGVSVSELAISRSSRVATRNLL
jgi:hypothetical protein